MRTIFFSLLIVTVAAAQAPVESITTGACATLCEPAKPALPPYAGPLCERSTLTGDWLGCRSRLRDDGFTITANSTQFYQGVVDGGLQRGFRFGGRADVLLDIDGEKAGLMKGMFIQLHDETLYGQSVNGFTGALGIPSLAQAVPVPNGPVNALTSVKVTQFLSETFCVFGGKINTLDGFQQPFAGYRGVTGFMNANFNVPVIVARTVPYSTYAAGAAVLRNLEPVLTVMVLDTNNTPTTTGFDSFFDNGVSVFGTANLPTEIRGRKGHIGLLGSYSNRSYTALDGLQYLFIQALQGQVATPPRETGSWNVAVTFDQTLGQVCCDPKRTWGLFGNAGISDGNPNPVRWNAAVGIGGATPFAGRPLDSFGVAYYYLGLSDTLKRLGGNTILRDEQGVEAYYNVGVTPWCNITADLQVINPARKRVETDLVVGVRAKIDF